MSSNSIKVFAPASVSNVGPGFDLMGFAIHEPGDEIILRKNKLKGIKISKITGDGKKLPTDPEKNTATVAILSLFNELKIEEGISVEIRKKMGMGSGLGSSAASAVAAVFAANKLLNLKRTKHQLLPHAMKGESIASGDFHADNVAPSLFGGFILIRSYNPIDMIKINTPPNLFCTIIYPQVEIKTIEARKILPKKVTLKQAINHSGNAAALMAGLLNADLDLIQRSLVDEIVEPVRAKLIPGFDEIKKSALQAGALNCNISGSGPSLFALSTNKTTAEQIALYASRTVKDMNIKCLTYISKINKAGPRVLD